MPELNQGTLNPAATPNIGFKLGTQAAMDVMLANNGTSSAAGEHGVFYLTSDTHRLYIGNSDKSISAVNEGVISVANYTDLPSLSSPADQKAHAGQFYYITTNPANVLCVASGGNWVQINSSVSINSFGNTVTTSSNVATIAHNIRETNGGSHTSTVQLEGTDGNTITSSGSKITIKGNKASLAAAANGQNKSTLTLTNSNSTDSSVINLEAGANATLAVSGQKITIGAQNTMVTSVTGSDAGASANGFKVTVNNSDGSSPSGTIDPIISYGDANDQQAHFVGGIAALSIYTKAEVDDKIEDALADFDAMTYRGTTTGGGLANLTDVHRGDVWILTQSYEHPTTHKIYPAGSMVIAQGTEVNGVIPTADVTWDFVDSSGTDTTYTATAIAGGIKLTASTGADIGQLTIVAGDLMSVSSSANSGSTQAITVGHQTVTRTNQSANAVSTSADGQTTINVLTGIETDNYGHITKVVTTPYNINTSHSTFSTPVSAAATAVSALVVTTDTSTSTTSSASVAATFQLTAPGGSLSQSTATFGLASETLTIARNNSQVSLNLLWGSF